ncbi:MAG: hypothetical protein RIT24_1218 [Planctomycetota bacterium]
MLSNLSRRPLECAVVVVCSLIACALPARGQGAVCQKAVPVTVGETPFANQAGFGAQVSRTSSGFGEATIWRAGWFSFTPAETGNYEIGVCGASVDTKMALGAACPTSSSIAWNVLAYNDDSCAFTGGSGLWASRLSAINSGLPLASQLNAGQTYLIAVGGYSASTAPAAGSLSIALVPPPTDPCAGPSVAAIGMNALAFDGNTPSLEIDCAGNPALLSRANVLRFTAPYSGAFAVNTCAQATDTVLAVLRTCGDPASVIGCNDDGCGAASRVVFNATAGEVLFLTVGLYGVTTPAPAVLAVEVEELAPPADPCQSIATLALGVNAVALDATRPNLTVPTVPQTVVHKVNYVRFTAPQAGVYRVSNCADSLFDSIFVRVRACNDPAAVLAIDDDGCGAVGGPSRLQFFSEAGASTLIGIGAWSSIEPPPATTAVQVAFVSAPADPCAAANVLVGAEGALTSVPMNIAYRGLDLAGQCDLGAQGTDVIACARIVRYTALTTGACTIGTCSDADPTGLGRVDSRIAVLAACGDAASVIACDDDGCTGGAAPYTSRLTFDVVAGTTYFIAVGGFDEFVTGPFRLEIGVPVPPANPADINSDGVVDGADLTMLLSAWGTTDAAADVDGDGTVGGSDLAMLLSAWG